MLLAVRLSVAPPRSVEGLAAIAAVMLAILPIRSVLVPANISSLTLVDFVLASEMATLAAGAALVSLWPGINVRPRRRLLREASITQADEESGPSSQAD